eukprot:GEMP01038672.1.p1 GENE.GEMP01038672.1~~GEMP01038672.1.p1  ORF type:complete len:443 (+),score=94.91 GEMP01038672.1:92-1420(+)
MKCLFPIGKRVTFKHSLCRLFSHTYTPMHGVQVDNFKRDSASIYLLSHFHADHLSGLTQTWPHTLYTSKITALLVAKKFPAIRCVPLSLNYRHELSPDVSVTLFDAHHVPGSVCFLVHCANKETFFHSGDFRWALGDYQHLMSHVQEASHAFLDNTYLDPQYSFPPRSECLQSILRYSDSVWPCQLVVAIDAVGKEEIIASLARHLNTRCYLHAERYDNAKLVCGDYNEWCSPFEQIEQLPHTKALVAVSRREFYALISRLPDARGIRATGWAREDRVDGRVFHCPYSLHCDYAELVQFAAALAPTCTIHLNQRIDEKHVVGFSDLVDGRRVTWQAKNARPPGKARPPKMARTFAVSSDTQPMPSLSCDDMDHHRNGAAAASGNVAASTVKPEVPNIQGRESAVALECAVENDVESVGEDAHSMEGCDDDDALWVKGGAKKN